METSSSSDRRKRCIQWRGMTPDILTFILEMFCNPTAFFFFFINHRFRPWTQHLFRVKTFTSPPPPSPSIFLQAVIQRAAAAHTSFLPPLQHTARERLSFINNLIYLLVTFNIQSCQIAARESHLQIFANQVELFKKKNLHEIRRM